MANFKRIFPLFLILLTGCSKPGLRGVSPYNHEVGEADLAILNGYLPPSRNLPPGLWGSTLQRVIDNMGFTPISRTVELRVNPSVCAFPVVVVF